MPNDDSLIDQDHEWQPCRLFFPRSGLWLDRTGVNSRLILPGRYLVRRSRTFGRRLYRADNS